MSQLAQPAGELLRAGGVLVGRAIGVAGHADDQGVGLPFPHTLGHGIEPRGGGHSRDRGLRAGLPQQPVPHRHAGALGAEIESEKGLQARVDGAGSVHARPAVGESMVGSMPSSASAWA